MAHESMPFTAAAGPAGETGPPDAFALLGDALQRLGAPMALFDEEVRFVAANETWRRLFYAEGEAPEPGTHTSDITRHIARRGLLEGLSAETVEEAVPAYEAAITSCTQNLVVRMTDGRWLSCSSDRTELGGYLLVFRDITAERQGEEARQSAIEEVIETLSVGVALWDKEARFVVANRRYHEIWFPEGLEVARPAPGEHFRDIFRRVTEAGQMEMPPGFSIDGLVDLILSGPRQSDDEFILETPQCTVSCATYPSPLGGFLHEFTDVTKRLRAEAELERQREVAHQSEKLSALGELLAGVAHELNNPLGIAQGYAQLLEARDDLPQDAAEQVEMIARVVERSTRIVRTFLAMARQRPARLERLELAEVAEAALDVSGHGLRSRGIEPVLDLEPDLPQVTGDFDQLAQVLSNLVINAGQALEERPGAVRVTVLGRAEGDTVLLAVEDDGPGIPAGTLERIFEPFFTTKDDGEGTGIGLAFCHRIVTAHGGTLRAVSAGPGARFEIRLPRAPDRRMAVPGAPRGGGRAVLVVHESEVLAEELAAMLREADFAPTVSTSARAALRRIDSTRFDAVLASAAMPELDGPALWRASRMLAPGIERRMAFIAAPGQSATAGDILSATGCRLLTFPPGRDDLLALVDDLCFAE